MKLHNEDCIEQMQKMIDEEVQVDSVVTDPPYGIHFMGKDWDKFKGTTHEENMDFQKWCNEWATLCFKLLKPGGYILAFSSARTYHHLACGIESAGFEVRDQLMWLYGSGFPKSLNIGKAVDKKLGNKRKVIGEKVRGDVQKAKQSGVTIAKADANKNNKDIFGYGTEILTKGDSKYEGWGTALKPAHEPIVMARKPLEGTVAENVLEHGTGGINIDECRIGTEKVGARKSNSDGISRRNLKFGMKEFEGNETQGRFPANVMHDGSEVVVKEFPETSKSTGGGGVKTTSELVYDDYKGREYDKVIGFGDEGSAARFFYCPKVSKSERNRGVDSNKTSKVIGHNRFDKCATCGGYLLQNPDRPSACKCKNPVRQDNTMKGNVHPTVKPVELMEYLCRLVTPKGGTVLDPFMGSGSTGIAAKNEGFEFIGIEKEKEYYEIAEQRINTASPLLDFL